MPRRVSLPTADDLFRATTEASEHAEEQRRPRAVAAVPERTSDHTTERAREHAAGSRGQRRPSGRIRHDEKMTVYVTADELLDIEHARLSLRRQGLAVDRGRLVREAIAIALADLEENAEQSVLWQRLAGS